jgi:enoyl-CoA hydratase/carnithine racemase
MTGPSKTLVITADPIVPQAKNTKNCLPINPLHDSPKPPTWIAGGDLRELDQLATKGEVKAYVSQIHGFLRWVEQRAGAVIMVIDGLAIGGGAEFSLSGDIRLATAYSQWSFKQGSLGLTTGFGGASRLVSLVGTSRSEKILYGMQTINSHSALEWGFIHEIAETQEGLWSLVHDWCQKISQWHPEAFAAQKAMLYAAKMSPPGTHRALETELFVDIWGNPLHRQKTQAFLAKK